MRSLMLVALASGPVWAGAAVMLFPAIGTPSAVTLSGRVLKHAPGSGSTTLSKNLRRLASSNWEGAEVEVRFGDRSAQTTSGHDGNYSVTFVSDGTPFEVGVGSAEAMVKTADVGIATVHIVDPKAPFIVVSDFDDTIAVTHVIDTRGLVKAALLQDGADQPAVQGMARLYDCLADDQPARPGFMLVSGSPAQYLPRVKEFLRVNRFTPAFGISLRDFGPSTMSGYKQPVIRALLQQVPNDVVFVGDSGEHDPEVYAELRAEFPGRVKAIYIRNAGRTEDPKRFEGMVLFATPRDAAQDAAAKGLMRADCVTRIPTAEEKRQ